MSTLAPPVSALYFAREGMRAIEGVTAMRFEQRDTSAGELTVLAIADIPVFRSGTFRDSMGRQNTWEKLHIHDMVRNFEYLRERGIFPDVPVRAGHPAFLGGANPIQELVGHITSLRAETRTSPVDGKEYEYLLASYDIVDEVAQRKISAGLWRNRSAEIGTYIDNAEAEYAPTFMGVAYVDIPAVESLNAFAKSDASAKYTIMTEDSMPMPKPVEPEAKDEDKGKGTAPAPAPAPVSYNLGGAATTDPVAVQQYITALEARNAELDAFQRDTVVRAREDFVAALARDGKIGANTLDAQTAFAKSLSEEQYAAWTANFEAAAPDPLFATHGRQSGGSEPAAPAGGQEQPPAPDRATVHKSVLARLHTAGVKAADIEKTSSFAAVKQADPAFSLGQFLRAAHK